MNAKPFLLLDWSWSTTAVLLSALTVYGFWRGFGRTARWGYVAGAIVVVAVALMSPLEALAKGVLFSAHMTQHILLLLIAPALLWLALPRNFSLVRSAAGPRAARDSLRYGDGRTPRSWLAPLAWAGGIGAMWVWHYPALCDAAALNPAVRATQTLSLLALGSLFWWPILAPQARDRLLPGQGVLYLFTACLGCTALGIMLTLTPIEVCSAYRAPLAAGNNWAGFRELLSAGRDRQIGGLLMWVPMCSIYVGAIMLELSRWFGGESEKQEAHS